MLDIRKKTQSVALWREDIIKFSRLHPDTPISSFLCLSLHAAMSPHRSTVADRKELKRQMEEAREKRRKRLKSAKPLDAETKGRNGKEGKASVLISRLAMSEAITIPARVRKNPIFVGRGKKR